MNTTLVKTNRNLNMKFFKRIKFPEEIKTLIVENLNKNTSEEDLYELFGLQSTTYLKDNSYAKIALSKSGSLRGFAFITVPNYVCTELIKIKCNRF